MSDLVDIESKVKDININSYLECTVCLDFAVSPINSCKNGHILCGICKEKISQCPTCQDKNVSVNSFLERILKAEEVELSCRNKDHGCTMKIKPHEMKGHLATLCDFRPIKCEEVLSACDNTSFTPKDFLNHFLDAHKYSCQTLETATVIPNVVRVNSSVSFPEMIYAFCLKKAGRTIPYQFGNFQFDNNTFLQFIRVKGENIFTWITMLGHEAVANKYQFSISFTSKLSKSATKQIRFDEIPVHCLQYYDLEKIKELGHVAIVSYSAMKLLHDEKPNDPDVKFEWNNTIEVSQYLKKN